VKDLKAASGRRPEGYSIANVLYLYKTWFYRDRPIVSGLPQGSLDDPVWLVQWREAL
jgi:hypothetical protein